MLGARSEGKMRRKQKDKMRIRKEEIERNEDKRWRDSKLKGEKVGENEGKSEEYKMKIVF